MLGKSLGHYRILHELGSGGMGQMFAAEDTKLKRRVALKVLLPEAQPVGGHESDGSEQRQHVEGEP